MPTDFRLDGWFVQPDQNRLSRGAQCVRLEPKVMQVLEVLAERPGAVVSREVLVARVWTGVHVTDDVVHRAIRELRRALGDEAARPRVIETIRKRGYRLMVEVTSAVAPPSASVPEPPQVSPRGALPGLTGDLHERGHAGREVLAPARKGYGIAAWAAVALALVAPLVASLTWRAPIDVAAAVRFTTVVAGPGNEAEPALTPDGLRLAYVVRALPASGAPSHVFVADADGMGPRPVTSGSGEHRTPAWSPDGRSLVVARHEQDGACALVRLDVAEGAERTVGPCPNPFETRVDWAASDALYVSLAAADPAEGGWRIARLPIDGGAPEAVTAPPPGALGDHSPRLSPDGRGLAFLRQLTARMADLYVMRVGGHTPTRVSFDDAAITGFDWAPGGDALIVSSDRAGSYTLWRVPIGGGSPRFLAGGAARLKHPVVSRADGRILYESWTYDINLWASSGGPETPRRRLTASGDAWHLMPALSPDGSRLAFVSTRTGAYEVWLAGSDGGTPRPLTAFRAGYVSDLQWTPDGRRLLARVEQEGRVDLHLVNLDGATRALTRDDLTESAPSWSSDGRAVYFSARDTSGWHIWRYDVDTGARRRVAPGYAARETADARAILVTRDAEAGLWRHPLDGGAPSRVLEAFPRIAAADWQVKDDGVYLVRWEASGDADGAGGPVVVRLGWDGTETRVARVPDVAWNGFALTPDRRGVLYARADRRESHLLAITPE